MIPTLLLVVITSVLSTCSAYPLRLETNLWQMTNIIGHVVWSITGEERGSGLFGNIVEDEQGLNKVGWHDPRLYGGQMLDVCLVIVA